MFLDADDMQLPHTKSIAELKDALQRTSPQKSEPRRTSVSNSRPMSANEGGGILNNVITDITVTGKHFYCMI